MEIWVLNRQKTLKQASLHTEIDCLFRKMENDVSYFDLINTDGQINSEKLNMCKQTGGVENV